MVSELTLSAVLTKIQCFGWKYHFWLNTLSSQG